MKQNLTYNNKQQLDHVGHVLWQFLSNVEWVLRHPEELAKTPSLLSLTDWLSSEKCRARFVFFDMVFFFYMVFFQRSMNSNIAISFNRSLSYARGIVFERSICGVLLVGLLYFAETLLTNWGLVWARRRHYIYLETASSYDRIMGARRSFCRGGWALKSWHV